MLVSATVDYKAGGWPGEVYKGEYTVRHNVADDADRDEIVEQLAIRARQDVANKLCFTTASVHISNIRLES
jgi:hypothetical protein